MNFMRGPTTLVGALILAVLLLVQLTSMVTILPGIAVLALVGITVAAMTMMTPAFTRTIRGGSHLLTPIAPFRQFAMACTWTMALQFHTTYGALQRLRRGYRQRAPDLWTILGRLYGGGSHLTTPTITIEFVTGEAPFDQSHGGHRLATEARGSAVHLVLVAIAMVARLKSFTLTSRPALQLAH